jgi:uncharacterized protein (DUF1499 family)
MSRLKPCPDSPNCISSTAAQSSQRMDPLPFSQPSSAVMAQIKKAVLEEPRTQMVSEGPLYAHFTFKSAIMGFIDDVEFELDERTKLVHFRSASRIGYSDLGANRKRMENLMIKLRPQF